jgi:hypothetical protein
LKLGRHCNIVVKDWLEDCLTEKTQRLRAEKGYSLNRVLKRGVQTIRRQENYRNSFEAGVRAGHELIDNSESPWTVYNIVLRGPKFIALNHIYVDHAGFEYKAVCTRINTNGKVKSEKYTIYVHRPQSTKLAAVTDKISCSNPMPFPTTTWRELSSARLVVNQITGD